MLWRIVESSPGNYVDVFGHLQRPSSVLILPDFKLGRTSVFVSCCVLLMLGLEFNFMYLAWQRDMPHVENKEVTKRYKPHCLRLDVTLGIEWVCPAELWIFWSFEIFWACLLKGERWWVLQRHHSPQHSKHCKLLKSTTWPHYIHINNHPRNIPSRI
jgi:hypothetical protein